MSWSMENLRPIHDVSIMKNPIKEYLDHSLHIALERSDTHKDLDKLKLRNEVADWRVFKYLLTLDREWLLRHLKMTQAIFDYNVYKLPKDEQDNILL